MKAFEIPEYKLLKRIGAGGFSEVWLAERNNTYYAIKIPKVDTQKTLSLEYARDFLREAEIWSKLNHKNIVRVFEFDVKPLPYIVMEYCETSLREKIRELDISKALDIALKIAEALEYAHLHGVVHRDIKPENVLLCNGEPKLSDWGIAKVLLKTSTRSDYVGTPLYSAPEQLDPETYGEIDWRTDIWQFGCLFYEIIEKEPPFYADYPGKLAVEILTKPPRSFKKMPKLLRQIIMKCLEKKKEDRWRSMSLLIERLKKGLKPEIGLVISDKNEKSIEKLAKKEPLDNDIHNKIMNVIYRIHIWYSKYKRMRCKENE